MQCPFCGGSGKCYQQTITYEEVETNRTNKYLTKCFKCNGTGEIEQTNEEWFCGLSTEEKAEFLVMIQMSVMHPVKRGAVDMEKFIEEVVEWLKQPHKE